MSQRCGKSAQCYDDLLKMMQNKDVSPMVLFSRNKEDDILLYTQQYVDKLKKENNALQDRIDKAIKVLKLCNSKCSKEVIDILRGEDKDDNR